MSAAVRAVSLDLDDTLWPFAPVAERIEAALEAFLEAHAPRTAARYDRAAAHEAVEAVRRDREDLAHDMGASRREALRRMLTSCDEDPDLVDGAFAAVYDARQRVELHPDAAPALDRLAARFPLVAVTNGNADLERTGVAHWFSGAVHAFDFGAAKPDAAIFRRGCELVGQPPAAVLHAGDHLVQDVQGALDAGLQAAWVHRELAGDAPPGALRAVDLTALADALGC